MFLYKCEWIWIPFEFSNLKVWKTFQKQHRLFSVALKSIVASSKQSSSLFWRPLKIMNVKRKRVPYSASESIASFTPFPLNALDSKKSMLNSWSRGKKMCDLKLWNTYRCQIRSVFVCNSPAAFVRIKVYLNTRDIRYIIRNRRIHREIVCDG